VCAHVYPPRTPGLYRLRNEQLEKVASRIAGPESATILAGDLNTTPWSPVMRDFEETTGLTSARAGRGNAPTWPSWSRFLAVPIDHVYHSDHFVSQSIERVPIPGSDHHGLLARFHRMPLAG